MECVHVEEVFQAGIRAERLQEHIRAFSDEMGWVGQGSC